MHLLAVCGSLRRGSLNGRLLDAAVRLIGDTVRVEIWDGLDALPHYSHDRDTSPPLPAVARLREAIRRADGLLVATPEYNRSLPGGLKNALDWASVPFPDNVLRDKPAIVIGASTGLSGTIWAQAEARKVLTVAGADVVDSEIPLAQAADAFADDGTLLDGEYAASLSIAIDALRHRMSLHLDALPGPGHP